MTINRIRRCDSEYGDIRIERDNNYKRIIYRKLEVVILTRADNVLNMQITIVNCMKQEWDIDFGKISDILEKYDLLSYINVCYEEYNSMGIKGILQDLKFYMDAIGEDV